MQYNTATKATYTPTFVPNVANSWIIPSELIRDCVRFAWRGQQDMQQRDGITCTGNPLGVFELAIVRENKTGFYDFTRKKVGRLRIRF